jgi:hypothetical protein
MFKKYLTTILSFFFTLSTLSYASISHVDGDKVYLQPGSVQIANNGIFINVAGELKAVNNLEIDTQGVYFNIQRVADVIEPCPSCGIPLVWGKCINPNCPGKKKKK